MTGPAFPVMASLQLTWALPAQAYTAVNQETDINTSMALPWLHRMSAEPAH